MNDFTVNWAGKEEIFTSKIAAIEFMRTLDDSSDLWDSNNTLLASRFKNATGTFKYEVYT